MAWYKTGTISVTTGTQVVRGVGTDFARFVDEGEGILMPDGELYEIRHVVSATELRLAGNYPGPTIANATYSIAPVQGYIQELARRASELIDLHSNVPLPIADAVSEAIQAAERAAASESNAAFSSNISISLAPHYGPTPPVSPVANATWITDSGLRFTWIVDADSAQWVETGSTVNIGYQTTVDAQNAAAQAAVSAAQAKAWSESAGMSSAHITSGDELIVHLADGSTLNLGNVRGAKGDQGDKGDQGEKGDKGDKGDRGGKGDSFSVSAAGVDLAGRDSYDGEAPNFTYLDTSTGLLYVRLDPTGWSVGLQFGKGDKGDPGTTDYEELTNKPSFGTAATHDVASSGNADVDELVKGDDTRLTNARLPIAHTHTAFEISDASALGQSVLTAPDVAAVKTLIGIEHVVNAAPADMPISTAVQAALDGKQEKLVSGTNIKTINGEAVIGSGNIVITGIAGGDMSKAVYDADGDGVVDSAASVPWTGITGKPNLSLVGHTHTAAEITGLPTGGGGGTGAEIRIVVLGDSLTAQQPLLGNSWPVILQDLLRSSGASVDVFNLAVNGWTFNRANTMSIFGSKTMVQRAIEMNPDIVIVALGFNDSANSVEGRTLSQVQTDALNTFTSLRSGLPNAKLIYASEVPYDVTHGTPTGLLNRQVIPIHFQKRTSGYLTDVFSGEIMPDAVSASTRTNYGNWVSLNSYIRGLSQVTGSFDLNLWRAHRLGLGGTDTLHLTNMGSMFLAGYARKAFKTIAALSSAVPNLSNQNYASFDDPDGLFNLLLYSNGTQWVEMTFDQVNAHPLTQWGPTRAAIPLSWYLPNKGNIVTSSLSHTSGNIFTWQLVGMRPSTQVQYSMNGASFVNHQGITDPRGNYLDSAPITADPGTYTFRYKVGNEVVGPITLTVTAASVGGGGAASTAKALGRLWGLTGTVGLVNGGETLVNFNSGLSTALNGMTSTSVSGAGAIVVPRAGLYRVMANCLAIAGSSGAGTFMRLYRRRGGYDQAIADGSGNYAPGTSYALLSSMGTIVDCSAGDILFMKIFSVGGGTLQNTPGGLNSGNYFIVEEV